MTLNKLKEFTKTKLKVAFSRQSPNTLSIFKIFILKIVVDPSCEISKPMREEQKAPNDLLDV